MNKLKLMITIFTILLLMNCTRIDAGHEGILVKQYGTDRGVQDITLVTGRIFYNPITENVYEFPIYVQTYDVDEFSVNARDGSMFTVHPMVSLNIIPGKSAEIFKKYRRPIDEILKTSILTNIKEAFRIEMNKYTTEEIISNREKFETEVKTTLSEYLIKDGFHLEQLTSGLKYPQVIVEAINAKNQAVQNAMRVDNELKVSEAEAKKMIVTAEAEAKVNELKNRTLTPLIIQQLFIDKWDGQTPLYGVSPTLFKNVQ